MSPSSRLIVPALRGACVCARREALSSSSVVARQSTGGHLFRIRGYSLVDRMVPAGEAIFSGEFSAANHKWRLKYYPNGVSTTQPDTVQVKPSLGYDPRVNEVYAAYRVSILDTAGNPAYSLAVGPQRFGRFVVERSESDGELVSTEELRRSMERLVDHEDCLNVRFDVNVLEFDSKDEEPHTRTDDPSCTDEKTTESDSDSDSDSESDYTTDDD